MFPLITTHPNSSFSYLFNVQKLSKVPGDLNEGITLSQAWKGKPPIPSHAWRGDRKVGNPSSLVHLLTRKWASPPLHGQALLENTWLKAFPFGNSSMNSLFPKGILFPFGILIVSWHHSRASRGFSTSDHPWPGTRTEEPHPLTKHKVRAILSSSWNQTVCLHWLWILSIPIPLSDVEVAAGNAPGVWLKRRVSPELTMTEPPRTNQFQYWDHSPIQEEEHL